MRFDRIRAVVLDLDGVVYIENRLLPRVRPAIAALRARGLKVLFVTNNAETTRAGFAARLSRLGVPCRPAEIINAARAAAAHLRRTCPRGSRFFVFGRKGLWPELAAAGFKPVTVRTRAEWRKFQAAPPRLRGVVTGFNRSLTYWGLCAAHLAVRRGAQLVACNRDTTYPIRGGDLPGTGSLVRLLETSTGQRSLLIGKPSPVMFRLLLREHGLAPRQAIVVGDRLEIDIAGGRAAGACTVLVLTGIGRRRDVARAGVRPHLVLRELSDLLRLPGLGRIPS